MKKWILVTMLSAIMLAGCSKKEEGDIALVPEDNYDWSNIVETSPDIILRDEYSTEMWGGVETEIMTGTETETMTETETETETKPKLSDITLSGVGSYTAVEPEVTVEEPEIIESPSIVESVPAVINQRTCSHVYEQTGSTKEPTCTKDGYTMYKCTVCGKIKSEPIAATGHDYAEEVVAPTCTAMGYTLQKCSKCGSSSKSKYTAVTLHTEAHTSIQDPQCIVEGIDEIRCSVCHTLLRYENVKPTGHDWEKTSETQACDPGAEIKYVCKRCGLAKTEKLKGSHSFGSWKVETVASCTAMGKQTRTCSVCQYVESQDIAKVAHILEDWKVDREATCSAEGSRSRTCSKCNQKVETEVIPKTAHTPEEWEVTKEATCSKTGLEERKCSVCQQTAEKRTIEKLEHIFQWVVAVEPTCVDGGLKIQQCTRCQTDNERKELPALGHSYMIAEIVEPKCEIAGYKSYKCSRCEDAYNEEIPASGHTYNSDGVCTKCNSAKVTSEE